MKEKVVKILIRALHTFAQTMLGMLGTESIGIFEVDWKAILSVSLMAAFISVLKSVAFGIPEYEEGSKHGNN